MKGSTMLFILAICIAASLIFLLSDKSEPTAMVVSSDSIQIEVHFCPKEDCSQLIAAALDKATETIHCALYNFDGRVLDSLSSQNSKIGVEVFSDNSVKKKLSYLPFVRFDLKESLMHNKFCIIDGKTVMTGSFNPVENARNDRNNVVILDSNALARNYENEFSELWNYEKNTKNTVSAFGSIENYFCPEDGCANQVTAHLSQAKKSIRFMVYSFTDRNIANEMIDRYGSGIIVQGLFDRGQLTDSVFDLLGYQGLDVKEYGGKGLLHDKVIIIDDKTVITGSYNPTNNGNRENDENILIIDDPAIARQYTAEFNSLFAQKP